MKRVFALFLLFSTTALAGQQPVERDRPVVQAMRMGADEKIAVDGHLEEAAWTRAVPITDFKQFEPQNGEPGTERTEIRIIFDKDNLYIGGELFDSDPKGLLGNQMVRDGGLGADDRFIGCGSFQRFDQWILFRNEPAGAYGRCAARSRNRRRQFRGSAESRTGWYLDGSRAAS